MSILVTGAGGFIGSALCKKLIEETAESIYAIYSQNKEWDSEFTEPNGDFNIRYADLNVEEIVARLMKDIRPRVIIHLAANANGNAGHEAMLKNVDMVEKLTRLAPAGCHFILASSITVYGDSENKIAPTSPYALSKLMSEEVVKMRARYRNDGFRYSIIRLCATVGGNMTHGLLPDMIKKLKSPSKNIELFGSEPGSIKPYIHVDDVVRVFCDFAIKNCSSVKEIDVRSADILSVLYVYGICSEILGIQKDIIWNKGKVWLGDNPILRGPSPDAYNFLYGQKTAAAAIRKAVGEYKSNGS